MPRVYFGFSRRFLGGSAALIVLLLLSNRFFTRFDLTDERVYTLSAGSRSILQNLPDEVLIKLYASKSVDDMPPAFKAHGRRVEELLREYVYLAQGKLKLEVIDPQPDTDEEVWANKYGVRSLTSPNGERAYLGAVLISGDREHPLPFFEPRKEDLLEFEISEALVKLQRDSQLKLGIYSSLFVGSTEALAGEGQRRDWPFVSRLKEFFKVEVYQNPPTQIPDDVKVFIVYQPKDADEKLEYALDQYVLRGGRLIVIVDPFSRSDLESQRSPEQVFTSLPAVASDLPRLFAHWGLRFDKGHMIGDPDRATRIDRVSFAFDYPYFLTLQPEDFSKTHIVTAGLKQILFAEPGALEWLASDPQLRFEPLLSSSPRSGQGPVTLDGLADHETASQQLSGERRSRTLAGLISGRFRSAFKAPPETVDDQANFIQTAAHDGSVLVIADTDFLHASQALETVPYGEQMVQRPRNDNVGFLTNATAYLSGSEELLSIRSSGRMQRPFVRLRELSQRAELRWKSEEDKLAAELQRLQQSLARIQAPATGEGEPAELSPEQRSELKRYKDEELRLRGLLREVRGKLRQDIENLGHQLLAWNVLLLPGLVSCLGVLTFWRRSRHSRV